MSDKFVWLEEFKANLEQKVIDKSTDEGTNMFFDLLQYEPKGTDNTGIMYTLWVNITMHLFLSGWTKQELIRDLTDYEKRARDMMEDDDEQA